LIEGCAVNTINDYKPSVKHIKAIKEKYSRKDVKIRIDNYKPNNPGTEVIYCGLTIPVTLPNKITFESYIVNAFIDDMKYAGIYSDESTTSFTINFEKIDFNSLTRHCDIIAEFTTDINRKFRVVSEYNYEILFGDDACSKVARVFPRAVEYFISEVTKNPDFMSVLKNTNNY
jgi:hypothetical protein